MSASRQCCQQPFEDHRVGFSCSKPDRFLGGGGLGGCQRVRVGEGQGSGWGVGLPGVSTIQMCMSS